MVLPYRPHWVSGPLWSRAAGVQALWSVGTPRRAQGRVGHVKWKKKAMTDYDDFAFWVWTCHSFPDAKTPKA